MPLMCMTSATYPTHTHLLLMYFINFFDLSQSLPLMFFFSSQQNLSCNGRINLFDTINRVNYFRSKTRSPILQYVHYIIYIFDFKLIYYASYIKFYYQEYCIMHVTYLIFFKKINDLSDLVNSLNNHILTGAACTMKLLKVCNINYKVPKLIVWSK